MEYTISYCASCPCHLLSLPNLLWPLFSAHLWAQLFRFHIHVRSCGVYLSVSGLSHSAQWFLVPSVWHCLGLVKIILFLSSDGKCNIIVGKKVCCGGETCLPSNKPRYVGIMALSAILSPCLCELSDHCLGCQWVRMVFPFLSQLETPPLPLSDLSLSKWSHRQEKSSVCSCSSFPKIFFSNVDDKEQTSGSSVACFLFALFCFCSLKILLLKMKF